MEEKEIDILFKHIKESLVSSTKEIPISSFDSIDLNELEKVIRRFKYLPSTQTLINENNTLNFKIETLQTKLSKAESIRKEAKEYCDKEIDRLNHITLTMGKRSNKDYVDDGRLIAFNEVLDILGKN